MLFEGYGRTWISLPICYSKYDAAVGGLIGGLTVSWNEGRSALATFGVSGVIGWELGYWMGKRVGTYKAKHNPLPFTR